MVKCAKYHQDTLSPWEYLRGEPQHFWNFKVAYLPCRLFINYKLLVTINLWNCIYSSQMYLILTSLTGEQCSVNIFFAQRLWSKSMKHDKLIFSLWIWSLQRMLFHRLAHWSSLLLHTDSEFHLQLCTVRCHIKYSHSISNRFLYNGLLFKLSLMWLS